MPLSRTFGGMLDEVAVHDPTHAAVVDGYRTLSYGDLQREPRTIAKALLALGVRRADRVAVLVANRAEWVSLCFGAARIGAIFAPLNTWYQRAEIEWTLRHLDAVILIAEAAFLKHDYAADLRGIMPELQRAAPGDLHAQSLPALRSVVHIGDRQPGTFTWEEFVDLARGASEATLVVDPASLQPLPTGEAGLLLLRGYTTSMYYRQPDETAAAFTSDGYLITGDLCSLGRDGYVRYHSRLKEMAKIGGINVSPLEVEQLLLRHPAVKQAYVVAIPDAQRGETLVAFVESDGVTAAEVKGFLRERVASFKVPGHVLFRSDAEIPRVASGKVPRFQLRQEAMAELGVRAC